MALMSYNGAINFGLTGDYDSMPDLEDLAQALADSLEELAVTAGVELSSVGVGPAPPAPVPVPDGVPAA
jgi:hypothetical protein